MEMASTAPLDNVQPSHLQNRTTHSVADHLCAQLPEQRQHQHTCTSVRNDDIGPAQLVQPSKEIASTYPHLEKALQSTAPDMLKARQHPQTAELLDEFAAEELQTLSALLPANNVPDRAAGSTAEHALSNPRSHVTAMPASGSPDRTAAFPAMPEPQTDNGTEPVWNDQQGLSPVDDEESPVDTDTSPEQASKSRVLSACMHAYMLVLPWWVQT